MLRHQPAAETSDSKTTAGKQTLSMMSSATKQPEGGADHTREQHEDTMREEELSDELVHNLNELNTQGSGSLTRQGGIAKEGASSI
ncbi:hypothetical protein A4A49_64446 [Nicotiana attenuata]|uniref:Uncharacterized protein n=1 Tax=Nicotiana attenuata TaxID=49451 RepID=A0A1J6KZ77_NICAT|nr:hypothetical protein A4A49_64446 [Nicotiana attenuata]